MTTSVLSNYYGNAALALILAGTTYVALHESDPTAAGLLATEVSGGGYGRKANTHGAASGKTKVSNKAQTFTGMPACTVTHIAEWDATSGGNMIYSKELATPIVVPASGQVLIKKGDLALSL